MDTNLSFPVVGASMTAFKLPYQGGFDRDTCYNRTIDIMNITKQAWYKDLGPRLSIWLIPILLLLSNVELSPLDKRRFLAILHLLGDPFDSIWSLLHKLDAWDRCWDIAERYGVCTRCQRVVAAVFAGFEELEGPRITNEYYFSTLVAQHDFENKFHEWRRAAVRLADGRTDELGRTALAIVIYFFQLIASFVPAVGGDQPNGPPGGRIATGVFLSWLLPTILLSNAIGNLPSRRTCYDVLSEFAEATGEPLAIPNSHSIFLPGFNSIARSYWETDFFEALGWSGAIYSFRPWKLSYLTTDRKLPRALLIFALAVAPVCIGLTGGFVILWYNLPTGLNCRHMWLVGVFVLWCTSASASWLSYGPGFATGRYHWRFVLIKDALVAIPSFTVIIMSACGLFNSCYCWSGPLQYPGTGRVPLNGNPFYEYNDHTVYPTVVGVNLLLQMLIFGAMVILWRRGLWLLRWSERARASEWQRLVRHENCKCMQSM